MSTEGGGTVTTAERPTNVPPAPSEGERTPERRLLNPEMAGTQLILLLGVTPPKEGLDRSKIERIGKKEETPDTQIATKASYHERDEHWKDVAEDQRVSQWKQTTNAFFEKYKQTPDEGGFLIHIGIDLASNDVAQAVYDKFFHPEHGKGDIGALAKEIAKRSSDEITAHTELIRKLGKLYGNNSSEVLMLLVEGIKNAEPETVGPFIEAAQTQIQTGEQMQGLDIIQTLNNHAASWDQKAEVIRQQMAEQATPPPPSQPEITPDDETTSEAFNPDLATTNSELYIQTLLEHLAEKNPQAALLWNYAVNQRDISFDELQLDTTTWHSSINKGRHGITIGTKPMTTAEKHLIFVNDRELTYPDEVAYRLTHELSHVLYHYMEYHPKMQTLRRLATDVRDRNQQERGLTSLASDNNYDNKVSEDITELMAMELFDPQRLRDHLDFLHDAPDQLSSLGLAPLQNVEEVYNAVHAVVEEFTNNPPPTHQEIDRRLGSVPIGLDTTETGITALSAAYYARFVGLYVNPDQNQARVNELINGQPPEAKAILLNTKNRFDEALAANHQLLETHQGREIAYLLEELMRSKGLPQAEIDQKLTDLAPHLDKAKFVEPSPGIAVIQASQEFSDILSREGIITDDAKDFSHGGREQNNPSFILTTQPTLADFERFNPDNLQYEFSQILWTYMERLNLLPEVQEASPADTEAFRHFRNRLIASLVGTPEQLETGAAIAIQAFTNSADTQINTHAQEVRGQVFASINRAREQSIRPSALIYLAMASRNADELRSYFRAFAEEQVPTPQTGNPSPSQSEGE